MKLLVTRLLKVTVIMTLMSASVVNAQRIAENETDEFTGVKKVATNWGTLYMNMSGTMHYRIRVLDKRPYLHVKLYTGSRLVTIRQSHQFMLKLENDSIVKLSPSESSVGCFGCASIDGFIGSKAAGVSVYYPLSVSDVNSLVRFGLKKTRIYTDEGYFEEQINEKKAIVFRDYFRLLYPRGIE